jgi:hypothetical protein
MPSGRIGENGGMGTCEDSAEAAPVRADSHRRCVVAMRGAGANCAHEGRCNAVLHLDQRAFWGVSVLHYTSFGQRAVEASGRRRPGRERGRDAHHVSARTTCCSVCVCARAHGRARARACLGRAPPGPRAAAPPGFWRAVCRGQLCMRHVGCVWDCCDASRCMCALAAGDTQRALRGGSGRAGAGMLERRIQCRAGHLKP